MTLSTAHRRFDRRLTRKASTCSNCKIWKEHPSLEPVWLDVELKEVRT